MASRVPRGLVLTLLFGSCLFAQTACKNTKAVCPGAGQSSAADFSPFNAEGQPKTGKKKKDDNGLINKKQPKRLNKR